MNDPVYLRAGDVIELDGRELVVTMVNESRAHAVPTKPEIRLVKFRGDERLRRFKVWGSGVDISPNSEVDVVRRVSKRKVNQLRKVRG